MEGEMLLDELLEIDPGPDPRYKAGVRYGSCGTLYDAMEDVH